MTRRTRCGGFRAGVVIAAVLAIASVAPASSALAAFPWPPSGGDPTDYSQYRLPSGSDKAPNDLGGSNIWKFAATPDDAPESAINNADPVELDGVRGASLVDDADVDQGWRTTTGRPDVVIAVLDSGIKWNDRGAMVDLRRKTRLSKGEAPEPRNDSPASPHEAGVNCASYNGTGFDINGDGVFNVVDYACDDRVNRNPARGVGPSDLLDPQDVLIAFSDGDDDDSNGFKDDIVGWDFLDDDNDPYDDVQYGHGTGEAEGSSAEADNAPGDSDLGTCPNCMVVHLRVGDSFIADVNRFAQATIYAVDNGALVVQEALGAMNNSRLSREAVNYAYGHGVTVIASAADEAAQHNNWPSSLPHVILVNSVVKFNETFTPANRSYLQFNGCTNFNAKMTLAIPSTSCSSDATAVASGMAGLVYSAALNARQRGDLEAHPDCTLVSGDPCAISANEVRQLMASGRVGGTEQADDVNFARALTSGDTLETSCTPIPLQACTDPFLAAPPLRPIVSPLATTRRYPARRGHDQFYGYGRVNMNRVLDRTDAAALPPEVEITSPEWFAQVDPEQASATVRGDVSARGQSYTCRVYVAPGAYPNDSPTTATPAGDFKPVASSHCDGSQRSGSFSGALADLDLNDLRSRFPVNTLGFDGREPGAGVQTANGRPNTAPYGFVVKVEATTTGAQTRTGRDRRQLWLHRDQDMLPGFPRELGSDGESSPAFVDLDGDNRNELVFGSSDGFVHALRPDGGELPGWPVRTDQLPLHDGGRAFTSNAVPTNYGGAVITAVAAGDLDRDGKPEVVVGDLEGKISVWSAAGARVRTLGAKREFSGAPLQPFENVRNGKTNRTSHRFLGSPVLADLDRNDGGKLEIVAAGMDRHLYAWNDDGTAVDGFPVLVVDRDKVQSVDPQTHAVTFKPNVGADFLQGAIVTTPAVANIEGPADSRPEILVGTNEEYRPDTGSGAGAEGPLNAGQVSSALMSALTAAGVLEPANGRLHAINPDGDPDGNLLTGDSPFVNGWPAKVAILNKELLPVVGEGINGSAVVAPFDCASGGSGAKIGVMPAAGLGYVFNADATSCYGQEAGRDRALGTDIGNPGADASKFAAVGLPAFGDLGGGAPTLVGPAAGVVRALDVVAPEYQGGSDVVAAWDSSTGQFKAGWPAVVNDLQFLTGPAVADIDGAPGEEVVAGTASMDLAAFNVAGLPAGANWPKLTGDWTITTPLIGSFGTTDTDSGARKVVVGLTRSGTVLAYRTTAPACSPGSSPRFHHDNANSGDYTRDATAPGRVTDFALAGPTLTWKAPGDDLLCGEADRYEVATSDAEITSDNFGDALAAAPVAPAPAPGAAGTEQSQALPADGKRWVAIRAVDEQGNVGRLSVLDRGAPGGGGGGGGPGGGGGGSGGGGTGGALGGTGGGGGTPGAGTPATPKAKKFSLGGITRHADGSITLKITVPGAGTVEARDADAGKASAAASKKRKALIKRQKRTVRGAGTVRLRLRPSTTGRAKLRQNGRAKVRVKVTYRPRGGSATSRTKQATLTVKRR